MRARFAGIGMTAVAAVGAVIGAYHGHSLFVGAMCGVVLGLGVKFLVYGWE